MYTVINMKADLDNFNGSVRRPLPLIPPEFILKMPFVIMRHNIGIAVPIK